MRVSKSSLALLALLPLLTMMAMGASHPGEAAQPAAEPFDLDAVRADLNQIDVRVSAGEFHDAAVLVGQDIKARDINGNYLKKASGISETLLKVRTRVAQHDNTLSLQQLGALSQRLTAENRGFRDSFQHGQESFQTYQLIQKAVVNLEDAISYWRLSNHYRFLYRGSVLEQAEDDEILKVKIQTAMNAIDELKGIVETRQALGRDLEE